VSAKAGANGESKGGGLTSTKGKYHGDGLAEKSRILQERDSRQGGQGFKICKKGGVQLCPKT